MQTSEKMAKQVKFAEDVKDKPAFTPLAKLHSSSLRKLWLKHCRNNEYEKLKQNILSYQLEIMV